MSQAFIIETGGETAGIIVLELAGYRFYAANARFLPLEQRLFTRPRDASLAARELVGAEPANGNNQRRRLGRGRRKRSRRA